MQPRWYMGPHEPVAPISTVSAVYYKRGCFVLCGLAAKFNLSKFVRYS